MPDSESGQDRSIAAMGERVAIVETKLLSLKEDTSVIRSALHSVNNEMQKFVGLEAQCVAHLSAIRDLTAHLPDLVAKMVGLDAKMASFEELKPRLQTVVDEHFSHKGGWRMVLLIGRTVMGAITMTGMIAGAIIWIFHLGH